VIVKLWPFRFFFRSSFARSCAESEKSGNNRIVAEPEALPHRWTVGPCPSFPETAVAK